MHSELKHKRDGMKVTYNRIASAVTATYGIMMHKVHKTYSGVRNRELLGQLIIYALSMRNANSEAFEVLWSRRPDSVKTYMRPGYGDHSHVIIMALHKPSDAGNRTWISIVTAKMYRNVVA